MSSQFWNPTSSTKKGVSTSTTFGISNSNMVGFSFSTYGNPVGNVISLFATFAAGMSDDASMLTSIVPCAVALNYSDNWSIQLMTNRKWVLGCDNKNTGGEYALCRGDKYETLQGSSYKLVGGTEYKLESKAEANRVRFYHQSSDVYDNVIEQHNEKKASAKLKAEYKAGESLILKSDALLTIQAADGNFKLQSDELGEAGLKASKFTVQTEDAVTIKSEMVSLGGGTATAVLEGDMVKLGPNVEMGMPAAVTAEIAAQLASLKEQVNAAQLAAAEAKANADSAAESATTAGKFADAAKGSADAAEGSADAAKGSADAAKGSADAAKGSADAAKGSADAAKDSADAAKGSADTAKGSSPQTL